MRALRALAVLALGAFVAAPLRADTDADIRGIADCLTRVVPKTPLGLDHLRTVCPDLEQFITDSGVADQLGDKWRERLGPDGLKELVGIMRRYQAQPGSVGPSPSALAAVVSTLRALSTLAA